MFLHHWLALCEYFGSAIKRARVSFVGPEQFSPQALNCSFPLPASSHRWRRAHMVHSMLGGCNQLGQWQERGLEKGRAGDTRVHQRNQSKTMCWCSNPDLMAHCASLPLFSPDMGASY